MPCTFACSLNLFSAAYFNPSKNLTVMPAYSLSVIQFNYFILGFYYFLTNFEDLEILFFMQFKLNFL